MNEVGLIDVNSEIGLQLKAIEENIGISIVEKENDLKHVNGLIMDRDNHKYIKSVRATNNKDVKAFKKSIKEVESKIIETIMEPISDKLEEYSTITNELSSTADARAKEFEAQMELSRNEIITDKIEQLLVGYGIDINDTIIDKIRGALDKTVYNALSTSDNKVSTIIAEWFENTLETVEMFEITMHEFAEYNFSERRYNAVLKDALDAATKKDDVTVEKSASVKVTMNEKLDAKKTARTTYRSAVIKHVNGITALAQEAGLTRPEYKAMLRMMLDVE